MRTLTAVVTAAAMMLGPCTSAVAADVGFAIVIGNNAPPKSARDEGLAELRYADDDAIRYDELFARQARHSALLTVPDAQTQRRYPGVGARVQAPTSANLQRVVQRFRADMEAAIAAGDRPILYLAYSGHGAHNGQGEPFLALLDGELTRVMLDELLAGLPAAYAHLIIDACHAGALVGARGSNPFAVELETTSTALSMHERQTIEGPSFATRHPTAGFIIATTAGQQAHEWSEIESGVFTHEVLSGLWGAADVNGDQKIEYSELQAFVAAANRRVRDPRSLPQVVAAAPAIHRNAAIVDLAGLEGVAYLRGNATALGRFYVETALGQRRLDAHLAGDVQASIAVPVSGPVFLRTATAEVRLEFAAGQEVPLASLLAQLTPREVRARGSIEASYREDLFAAPYSRAYYDGYVDRVGAAAVVATNSTTSTTPGSPNDGASTWSVAPMSPAPGRPRSSTARRNGAIAAFGAAGALSVATAITGAFAGLTKRKFDATLLRREAEQLSRRHQILTAAAATTGSLAVAAIIVGAVLWPKRVGPRGSVGAAAWPRRVRPELSLASGDAGGGVVVGVQGRW